MLVIKLFSYLGGEKNNYYPPNSLYPTRLTTTDLRITGLWVNGYSGILIQSIELKKYCFFEYNNSVIRVS